MSKLYIVPTPIGNLKDITFRAVEVLKEVDLTLAEDTRTSGKLLKHFEIKTHMQSHHMHNEHKTIENLIDRLKSGTTMALISDATIIVEASEKSGTKHQGWEALRLGRHLFILKNIVDDPSITWAEEMIKYGAQVLTREDMPALLEEIPTFTSSVNAEFTF